MLKTILDYIKSLRGQPAPRLRGFQLAPWCTVADLDALPAKTKLVRYQFRVHEVDRTSDEAYFAAAINEIPHLIGTLRLCNERGIKVAICVMTPPATWSGAGKTLASLWWNIVHSIQAAKLIDAVYGYDLLNEPQMSTSGWNELVPVIRRAIRALDKKTPLIISSTYGDPANLRRLKVLRDRRVIYTFHHYYPMPFTHQGVRDEFPRNRRGPSDVRLRNHLVAVKEWQERHRVRVYVGEFSCVRWAPEDALLDYLRESINLFEQYGWDWTYHAWREWTGWDLEHEGSKDSPVRQQHTKRLGLLLNALER